MRRILIISAVFPPEPVVSALLSRDLAVELAKKNNVVVLCPKPTRPYGFRFGNEIEPENYKVVRLNSYTCPQSNTLGRFRESYSFGKQCYQYIIDNHQDIEVIYANTWPLPAQYFTVMAAKKFDIPVIMHIQDIYPESLSQKLSFGSSFFNRLLLPLDKYTLNNADKIITISEKMKEYLVRSRKLKKEKFIVIPNWQDESAFVAQQSNMNDNEKSTFTFMYLGNIGPVAGVDLLLDAFAKSGLSKGRLIIAGSGSMKSTLQERAKNYVNYNIEFWSVPDGNVPATQDMADVLLLPMKKGAALTSVPSKLPAYMFSAKPVIACVDSYSDTAAAIRESDCGWVASPESVDELCRVMQDVVGKSKTYLIEKGEKGFNYAMAHYSQKENLPKLLSIIENAVSR